MIGWRVDIVIDNGEATADGMEAYLTTGASGSFAERFNGYINNPLSSLFPSYSSRN